LNFFDKIILRAIGRERRAFIVGAAIIAHSIPAGNQSFLQPRLAQLILQRGEVLVLRSKLQNIEYLSKLGMTAFRVPAFAGSIQTERRRPTTRATSLARLL